MHDKNKIELCVGIASSCKFSAKNSNYYNRDVSFMKNMSLCIFMKW